MASTPSVNGEGEKCPLSRLLETFVLQDPVLNSEDAVKTRWGSLALANMVAILRDHGFEVTAPQARRTDGTQSDAVEADTNAPGGADGTPTLSETDTLTDALVRFHHLTFLMDQNRGEDGRVDAALLENLLLDTDVEAYEKEGVEQLKQYLMKARENGIPLKFEGGRDGLHQVWFKGHRDLATAIACYAHGDRAGGTASSPPSAPTTPPRTEDWGGWRRRAPPQRQNWFPRHATSVFGYSTTQTNGRGSNAKYRIHHICRDERAFETDFLLEVLKTCGAEGQVGADAIIAEQQILELEPALYDIKPGVKRFSHYLMNMRAGGAPIWFDRDDNGQPKQIFIKGSGPFLPLPPPGERRVSLLPAHSIVSVEERFAALIEAYYFHLQPDAGHADGRLVQDRLESMDPDVYLREQCCSFKSLLKLARTSGLDIKWEQSELNVATIRIGNPV